MILIREPQEISQWFVAFHQTSASRIGRAVPGRFKHVSLFAHAPLAKTWVIQDTAFAGTSTILLPEGKTADDLIGVWTRDCAILKMSALRGPGLHWRGPLTCVSYARHVLGSRCVSITPDGLYRSLIKQGATVVFDDGSGDVRRRGWRGWRAAKPHGNYHDAAIPNPATANPAGD